MIFVTVGTHEQQFNRLIKYVDCMKRDKVIQEDVVMQTGYSTYEPEFCLWSKMFTYEEMETYVTDARIVITHGGPASFMVPLKKGKIPIVVPRQAEYKEHINNHQMDFCFAVKKRFNNIIVIKDIDDLQRVIKSYQSMTEMMIPDIQANNIRFNNQLEMIVNELLTRKND